MLRTNVQGNVGDVVALVGQHDAGGVPLLAAAAAACTKQGAGGDRHKLGAEVGSAPEHAAECFHGRPPKWQSTLL